jgi:FixJ family two-component response regulator
MPASQTKPLNGAIVMVVDDEFMIGLDTGWILEDAGAAVLGPFTTLPPSLKAAVDEILSLAIVDFRLGANETTAPLITLLAARGIPVIVYTGQRLDEDISGATIVIHKPAPQRSLVDAAAALLI